MGDQIEFTQEHLKTILLIPEKIDHMGETVKAVGRSVEKAHSRIDAAVEDLGIHGERIGKLEGKSGNGNGNGSTVWGVPKVLILPAGLGLGLGIVLIGVAFLIGKSKGWW